MGFSVSGAMVVILLGAFVAFGIAFPTMVGSVEQISGASSEQSDRMLKIQNGDIEITDVNATEDQDELDVELENTGTIELDLDKLDVLVDNAYVTEMSMEFEGDDVPEDTSLLLPGETVTITIENVDDPDVVVIITEFGHSDREEVQ